MIYYINDVTIDNEEVLVEYGAVGTATGTYEYGLQRLSVEHVNEAKEYYLYNGTGNVTQTTAENGSMFLRYTYNGEDYDYNTGLQYLRARYYSTGTGSFISQDTYLGDILNPLSQNRYTYVHNNPVMFVDPSGQFPLIFAVIGIGIGVGALIGAGATTYDAGTDGGTKKFSFDNIDSDDNSRIRKNAIIGGVVGGTSAAVGYIFSTILTTAFGASTLAGGTTLTLGESISIGVLSSVPAGAAGRVIGASLHNILYPNEPQQNVLAEAFDPVSTALDIASGALGGAATHYVTGGFYPAPYKNGTGNKSYLDDIAEQADNAKNTSKCEGLGELQNTLDDADDGIGAGSIDVDAPQPPRIPNAAVESADDVADDVFSAVDDSVVGGTSTLEDWVNRIPELRKQAPIEIPSSATVKVQAKNGYDQISFKWTENGQNYEVRWHTKMPGAPGGQGNTWVVSRVTPGTPTGQVRTEHILVGDTWIPRYQWQAAINAYKNGTATQEQLQLLKDGHWQAP